ncbi:reverse transcriptase [Plakobranchus ocellatus]|uniref:Reverse transcriptase n=1 Tax=Plakobranchus ocellatus TaxID=259542 RepID=A0AAV4DSI2_9GAST|nr:reverse transcriptase [Plakobranchus ocellatus]
MTTNKQKQKHFTPFSRQSLDPEGRDRDVEESDGNSNRGLSLSPIVLRYVPLIGAIVGVIGLRHRELLAGVIILPRVTGHPVLRVTLVQVEVVLLVLRPEIETHLVLIPGVLVGVTSLDLIRAVVLVWPRVVMTSHVISVVARDMCGMSAQVVHRKLILLVQHLNYLLIVVLLRVFVIVETPYFSGDVESCLLDHPIADVILGNINGLNSIGSLSSDSDSCAVFPDSSIACVVTRTQASKPSINNEPSISDTPTHFDVLAPFSDLPVRQREDPSLAPWFKRIRLPPVAGVSFQIEDGVLKRLQAKSEFTTLQTTIAVPESLRQLEGLATCTVRDSVDESRLRHEPKSKLKHFVPGDEVLVLLPTSDNKLVLSFKEPYRVIEKRTSVVYLVNLGDRRCTFHVNLLRKYRRSIYASPSPIGNLDNVDNACSNQAVSGAVSLCDPSVFPFGPVSSVEASLSVDTVIVKVLDPNRDSDLPFCETICFAEPSAYVSAISEEDGSEIGSLDTTPPLASESGTVVIDPSLTSSQVQDVK